MGQDKGEPVTDWSGRYRAGDRTGKARLELCDDEGREEAIDALPLELCPFELLGVFRGRTPELPLQTVQRQPMLLP